MPQITFAPKAVSDLDNLYEYLSNIASPATAKRYIDGILDTCNMLGKFPFLGISRDDIRVGLRTTHYKGNAIIAFSILNDEIVILGIFYCGQNWEIELESALSFKTDGQ